VQTIVLSGEYQRRGDGMDKIALVTDSTAYLSEEEIAQHAITVIPLTVNFADGFIYDGLVDTNEFLPAWTGRISCLLPRSRP